jgi:hypothetical protein
VVAIDLISNTRDAAPGVGADRNPSSDGVRQKSGHPGIVLRQGIRLLRIGLRSEAEPFQQRLHPLAHQRRQTQHVLILRRRQLVKFRPAIFACSEHAVEDETMQVRIAIQGVSETLYEGDRAALGEADIQQYTSTRP